MNNLYKILDVTEHDVGHAIGLAYSMKGQILEGILALEEAVLFEFKGSIYCLSVKNLELVYTQ